MGEHEIICREFVELVTEYLEGTLGAETTDLVEQHLVMCDWCRDYLGQFEATVEAVHEIDHEPPPKEMLERLLTTFRAQAWEEDI
jgi:predicted anti-sigma-YlaC factor YlaD